MLVSAHIWAAARCNNNNNNNNNNNKRNINSNKKQKNKDKEPMAKKSYAWRILREAWQKENAGEKS